VNARAATHTATVDRYLEAIYYIAAEGDVVRPGRISSWLDVAAPTVTDALRRLQRDGWVTTSPDRSVALTSEGLALAESIVRRHRVLERWLVDVLGLDWAAADLEAEALSSAISDEVIARIDASMGRPATCPHGNAIPGRDPGYGELVALSTIAVGDVARVRRVAEVAEHEGQSLLRALASIGVGEGGEVVVTARNDDGAVRLDVAGASCELAERAAASVWVERVAHTSDALEALGAHR
jgi:DtxR family Mn-dependent transcriptional regulator